MFSNRQTILASRPAAMVLALTLVAGLSAPFLMLPHAKAATALSCSENNHNGCTELSPTPPQDTVAVPPNMVLMLDDSGSMKADFMPDFSYLKNNGNNDALIDAANNGVYYDPTATYTPPPKADSTTAAPDTYASQTDMTNVPQDGFGAQNPGVSVNLYTYNGNYECGDSDNCGGTNGRIAFNTSTSVATGTKTVTNNYDNYASSQTSCTNTFNSDNGIAGTFSYTAHSGNWRLNGTKYNGGGECQFQYNTTVPTYTTYNFFQYSTSPVTATYPNGDPSGPYTVHYIAASATDCANAPIPANCVAASDTSGSAAPKFKADGVTKLAAGENVANWFAYNHTRILMAKSGLMSAFLNLSPNYRFGFGSINGRNNSNLPSPTGTYGQNSNMIAQVQPFGDGTSGTRKAAFWNWIATVVPGNSTPLRRSLQAVGAYYSSNDTTSPSGNAWDTMSSDPGYTTGSTTQYACRASYAIMTTDGFWNGTTPTAPSGIAGAAATNGPTYTPPASDIYTVTGYVAQAPYSGGASSSGVSLADVATYYWENDLNTGLANEVAPSKADPAFWQHMTTFTMGLGFTPSGITGTASNGDNPPTIQDIFNWTQDLNGAVTSPRTITGFGWPTPSSNSINNIADLAHAGVNGHGDFFSAKNPQDLAAGFAKAIADITARTVLPTPASVNASVATTGALSFSTGYSTGDWSGSFQSMTLKQDGTVDTNPADAVWDAAVQLDAAYHSTNYTKRKVYTGAYTSTATPAFSSFPFTAANAGSLDAVETAGLMSPPSTGAADTAQTRINYLLGDPSNEGTGSTKYRPRTTLLGAIIRSQPVYVASPSGNYYDTWPANSPEIATGAQSYDTFVTDNVDRAGTVYVGANDGMLHAFDAALKCNATDPVTSKCTSYGPDQEAGAGAERWAFIPRAVYANLGNLTAQNFSYRPTVDETPVTRDVFFSDQKWHTMLAGGVGLGGRGVYALDITDPTTQDFTEQPMTKYPASGVLWEFDSDMPVDSGCKTNDGTACLGTDLGYTVSQPNIGRIAYNKGTWVALVPNGYFPDCTTPDTPTNDITNCQAIAAKAPKDSSGNPYSALFVLDAQTGKVIAELKTSGVASFGLATPVMGDYDSNQVDDVAFAGDALGNLWRFDLTNATDPTQWNVTLVYQAPTPGAQPITTMPRLFPDPSTNRFMVVFGTGKFLGVGDNSSTTVQALMGVRDSGKTYTQTDLVPQYLHETNVTMPDGTTAALRCVTGGASDTCDSTDPANPATPVNDVPASKGGWVINLQTKTSGGTVNDAGERVVVNPGAIFASNTVVFETLITGAKSSDPCSPSTQGAILALNATNGSPAGASSLGGAPIAGGRISNARTSGSLPIVSALGGGQAYLPGTTLAPSGKTPISIDAPIWRRRSWSEINQN